MFFYVNILTALIKDNNLLEDLDKNWHKVAPITFLIENDIYSKYHYKSFEERKKSLDKLRSLYFSNEKFEGGENPKLFKNLSNIYGDRTFVHGVRNSALELRKHVPVYAGIFTKPGDVRQLKKIGIQEPYEVPHADELQFFFDKSERYVLTKELHEYSKKLINIWASFAKNGVPSINSNEVKKEWPIVDVRENEVNWLDLGAVENGVKIIEKPFENRLAFWDGF